MALHFPTQNISQMHSMFTLLILESLASANEQKVNDIVDYIHHVSTPLAKT